MDWFEESGRGLRRWLVLFLVAGRLNLTELHFSFNSAGRRGALATSVNQLPLKRILELHTALNRYLPLVRPVDPVPTGDLVKSQPAAHSCSSIELRICGVVHPDALTEHSQISEVRLLPIQRFVRRHASDSLGGRPVAQPDGVAEGLSPEKIRESSVAEQSARSFLQDTIVPLSNAVVLRRVMDVPFILSTVLFESRGEDLAGVFAAAIALKRLHSLVELCFHPCRKVVVRRTSGILLRKKLEAHVARRIINEEGYSTVACQATRRGTVRRRRCGHVRRTL